MKLKISESLSIPVEAVTQTFADLGIRGSGKTNTGVVIAEEMLKQGQQICALDPTDAWYGIRSSRDGKAAGFKVYVFGGEHGDIPLTGATGEGATMAEFLVESGTSVVFSLRHLSISEQRRFATEFGERLYELKGKGANRTPLHIFVDEADEFIPQRIPPGHERMFGAYDRLVRRGRSSGIGLTMISQRPQVLNKDTLSQCEILICHRLLHKLDRKAVLEGWVEGHDIQGKAKEFMESLASLDKGEAWFWSPSWLDMFKRVQVRWRDTFDSSFTPKAGERPKTVTRLAEVDLEALKEKLAVTIEKIKADDPKELKKEIQRLRGELAKKPMAPAATPVISQKAINDAVTIRDAEWVSRMTDYSRAVKLHSEHVDREVGALMQTLAQFARTKPERKMSVSVPTYTPPPRVNVPMPSSPVQVSDSNGDLSGLKLRIIRVLGEFEALGKTQVRRTVVSARAEARGGYFTNTVGALKTDGLIDYPTPGMISLTSAGRGHVNVEPPLTNREMYESCKRQLSGLEIRIFDTLYSAYPSNLSRDALSESVNARGGYFTNTIGKLRSMEFVEYSQPGFVKCSDWMFIENQ